MFKLDQNNFYTWPVKVELPDDGGKFTVHTFDAQFKRITQLRIAEITKLAEEGNITDIELANEVLVGWKGIMEGETEIPFSEQAKEKLLALALVPKAIIVAFFDSLAGAKRKN